MPLNETNLTNVTNIFDLTQAANIASENWLISGLIIVIFLIILAALYFVMDAKKAFFAATTVTTFLGVFVWILNVFPLPLLTGFIILWVLSMFVMIAFKD